MIVVTAGSKYIDIDAYACCVAYAELQNLLGKDTKAVSSAVLNESITPSLRALPIALATNYRPGKDDSYVLVDLSDPDHFDKIVDLDKVVEVFDHHPGFEQYWSKKIGEGCHIESIGAAATLIYEEWEKAGKLREMSQPSAKLLTTAILDNTLNFGSGMTTERDKSAYQFLRKHASLDDAWIDNYFSECQQAIATDLPKALRNDIKFIKFAGAPEELCVGQLIVWQSGAFIANESDTICNTLEQISPKWFANVVSISEGCSYFLCRDYKIQQWLEKLLDINFESQTGKADRLWLRKEIMKQAEAQAGSAATI